MLQSDSHILVTGAYGFIGSQFVKYLNSKGYNNIIVSDYLDNGKQFINLNNATIKHFCHPDNVLNSIQFYDYVFHFGAISNTTCWDGNLIMKRNYDFTTSLVTKCLQHNTPLSYSSSASVYGNNGTPLNLYAYSKKLVDNFVEASIRESNKVHSPRIQGFRYFNVYGLNDEEWHKGNQASPYYKFKHQALTTGCIELFEGSENFKRDFIPVYDVCRVQFEMSKRDINGIFDLGTGYQQSFLDIAEQVSYKFGGKINTIPFPDHLKGYYQTNTKADMSYL